jgi:hypothetical protein
MDGGRIQFLGQGPGGDLYRWARAGEATLAMVALPAGYVLSIPDDAPQPVAAKVVHERLVVAWVTGEEAVRWLMRKGEPGEVSARLNEIGGGKIPAVPGIQFDEPTFAPNKLIVVVAAVTLILIGLAVLLYRYWPIADVGSRGVALVDDREDLGTWYEHSYAVVVGINKYPPDRWDDLTYARRDAEGMAEFLENRDFEVTSLYDEEATKEAIIAAMQNQLAPRLGENDRVLLFFAGHGYTEPLNEQDYGYIVPYIAREGRVNSSYYISMEELRVLSAKMGRAKHHVFIMDACFGGLLGTKGDEIDPNRPDYIAQLLKRKARQVLTAGGKDQRVVDGGRGGHSVFTGYLIDGLQGGLADLNGDGYIPFSELVSYIQPAATNAFQTPGDSILAGHEQGAFVFRVDEPEDPWPEKP